MTTAFRMQAPCVRCGFVDGRIEQRSGQNCVFCLGCGRMCYNAPKTETGEIQRSVTTVHNGIKPSQRTRIILRANARCELCGLGQADGVILHVGHALSVDAGLEFGLTEAVINSDANLLAMCEECNLGLGRLSLPTTVYVHLLRARESAT